MIKEFKPVILFLGKFLILYFVLNIIYGYYVESFKNKPDPMTEYVSRQTAKVISLFNDTGKEIKTSSSDKGQYVYINKGDHSVLSVYEGCNGLNVFIVFVSFVLSFRPPQKEWIWFIPMGLIVIHIFNLGRIGLLFFITQHYPDQMYFMHKFGFTAIIYLSVFGLWWWWVTGKKFQLSTRKGSERV
ncbi:exosortase family protein XrtF [Mangrovivirga sp. M17]|uniref:Exosortase family protein XrtF n=1 Tax=Mangrovivirga halotolerans TaxID=2993936 RepID=A0ABT3RUA5_9BACT|nr:exosortase family protein XrtF [Mangrovivirga halotolerans]MCX2745215.1 exosortase family protein XrtF [Mangrovivirga halotolerans]